MKKMLIGLALFCLPALVHAESDMIKSTLIDNVQTVTQFSSGETNVALMDSIIRFLPSNDQYLVHLQFGVAGSGTENENDSANWIGGALVRFDPFISKFGNFPESWRFLKSINHGPAFRYNFTEKEASLIYQAGMAFSLNPTKAQ